MSLEETPVTVSRGGEQRRPSPEDINPMAFRPYPPISHSDELWQPDFPRPPLPEDTPMRERIRHYHIDFFDYVACQRREKYIYEAETYFWQELLEKCEERYSSSTDKTRICKKFSDAYRERLAYQTSNFSSFRVPTLTPGLPDLGPTPTAPQIDDRELKEELGKKYPLL